MKLRLSSDEAVSKMDSRKRKKERTNSQLLNCFFNFSGVVIRDEDLSRLPWDPRCSPVGYSLQVKKEILKINIQLLTLFSSGGISLEARYWRSTAICVVRNLPFTAGYSALIFTHTPIKDKSDGCFLWLTETPTSKCFETPEMADLCFEKFVLNYFSCMYLITCAVCFIGLQ